MSGSRLKKKERTAPLDLANRKVKHLEHVEPCLLGARFLIYLVPRVVFYGTRFGLFLST